MEYNQQNKTSIQTLFDKVAYNYDNLNNYMSFGLQKLIKKQAVKNVIKNLNKTNIKILDLCTGTGDIAILFKKYLPNSEIIGVDFSENMLKIAQTRTSGVEFYQCDITELGTEYPFLENHFDLCFIGFGLRNLPDIDNFLESIKYYLKPNGILSVLDLGKPTFIMKPYFFLHYEVFIPLMAKIFNKDALPYKYFIQSSKTYPSQKEMLKKLIQHGYTDVENKNFSFGIISQQLGIKK